MHTTLAGVALCAVRGGGLVDDALLHDGAVHGETVGSGLVGLGGSGGGDEGLEDGVLDCGEWRVRMGEMCGDGGCRGVCVLR